MRRRDARFTAGPYEGGFLVAREDASGSIVALVCDGRPGALETIADFWFADLRELELGVTEDGWNVEWLPAGSLGTPR